MRGFLLAKLLTLCLFLVCSCEKRDISYKYPDNPDYLRKSRAGSMSKKGALVLYGSEEDVGLENIDNVAVVDSALLKAAIEVIEILAPIASNDSENGLIASEWHKANASSTHRSKINVVIKGSQIKKENVEVIVFYQKKLDATWIEDGSDNSNSAESVAAMLQEKILARAREKIR